MTNNEFHIKSYANYYKYDKNNLFYDMKLLNLHC